MSKPKPKEPTPDSQPGTDTSRPPRWVRSIEKWTGRLCGAKGDDIVEGHLLPREAYGQACEGPNSALTAFAYLWRRFGPPPLGTDDHKKLVRYMLATPEKDVFLDLDLSGSALSYSVGYMAKPAVRERVHQPVREWERRFEAWYLARGGEATSDAYWKARMDKETMKLAVKELGPFPVEPLQRKAGDWRKCSAEVQRVNVALLASLRELLRPVFIRDVPINILGVVKGGGGFEHPAKPSKYAGYGIPLDKIELDESGS